jgi:hypothetical protein
MTKLLFALIIVVITGEARSATINVNPGDSVAAAVQSAQPGDTINGVKVGLLVPFCTNVPINKPLTITGYFRSSDNAYAFLAKPGGNNVTITGITCEGLLVGSFDNFHPTGWRIVGNRFMGRNQPGTPFGVGQWAVIGSNSSGGFVDCKITDNVFDPIEPWAGIYFYGRDVGAQPYRNVEIAYNQFFNTVNPAKPASWGRCIKIFGEGADQQATFPEGGDNTAKLWARDLWIHHNHFKAVRGMAIEKQDGDVACKIEDNYFEQSSPFGNDPQANGDNWAYSIVSARSVDEIIQRNFIDCRLPAGVNIGTMRVACEGGGCRQKIIDNYIIGNGPNVSPDGAGNLSIPINGTRASGEVKNNRIVNMPLPGNNTRVGAHSDIQNNGPNVALTWDINRPRPVPRTGQQPPVQIITVAATPNADGSLALVWSTASAGPYAISAKTSSGADPVKLIGQTPDKSVVLIGGHPGWEYNVAIASTGGATGSVRVRVAGDPNTTAPENDLKIKTVPPPTDDIASLKVQLAKAQADLVAAQQAGGVKDAKIMQLEVQVRDLTAKVAAAKAALQ